MIDIFNIAMNRDFLRIIFKLIYFYISFLVSIQTLWQKLDFL